MLNKSQERVEKSVASVKNLLGNVKHCAKVDISRLAETVRVQISNKGIGDICGASSNVWSG